ncbi:hypothetical protein R1sor_023749 [Riccia sorocarpa]|uniref:Ubiquitin-like protease family profile domain-containing protein n=2 Tax=Riccia sorocarpa TaxID=122646 RepID=A0ABD3GNJ1_9MARC
MQKRRDAKKDRLDETDSQNWSNIARDAVDASDIDTPTKSPVPKKRKNKSVKAESPVERPKKKSKVEKKKKEKALQKEAEEKKKKKKKDKKPIGRNDDDVDDDSEDDSEEEEEEKQTALRPVISTMSMERVPGWVAIVIPYNYEELRPAFPEYLDGKTTGRHGGIDDVWIAPPISSGTTVDSKGKSVVNEEDEHNPVPEVPKDTFAKPSGSGQPAPPYGDLPAKFEKFCSQFDSQRSEDLPDMFSDPKSVQKIQFATSLLADVCSLQAMNTDKYNSQYSQPVDLASSSQTDREKIDHSAEWDKEVHQKLIKHQNGLLPEIKNVANIRYIVVPIHGEYHWSVVLIHINKTDNACVIYHMDSIKTYHNHAQIGAMLNTWLERGLQLDMKTTIVATGITQQANNFDCGVHVLYIITKMIEAEKNGKLLEYLEKGGLPVEWGTAEIVANYRQEVRDLFISLVESDT